MLSVANDHSAECQQAAMGALSLQDTFEIKERTCHCHRTSASKGGPNTIRIAQWQLNWVR